MSTARFPFRFYGREPADWSPAHPDYVYELQFQHPLSAPQREKLVARSARLLAEGPASLGRRGWWWSGDRFALLFVAERYTDAPRMVFDRVAQLLVEAHGIAKIRDVVFTNAWGARGGEWDGWSRSRQGDPDPGPAAPDELKLPQGIRREVDVALPVYTQGAEELARESAAGSVRVEALAPQANRSPAGVKRAIGFEAIDRYDYPAPQPEDLSAFHLRDAQHAARWDELIERTAPPLARVIQEGRAVGIAFLNEDLERVETPFPPDAPPSGPGATDVEGLRATLASGNAIYELHLGEPAPKWRVGIHLNNGQVRGLAWVCDNLWAVLADSQLLVDDLSGPTAMYVGAAMVRGGTALIGARHGTIVVVRTAWANVLIGVCDWQLRVLATLAGAELFSHESGGELIFRRGDVWLRAQNVAECYEAWAAPIRKRAESCRKRRFANGRARRPPSKPHWIHVESDAVPRWSQQDRWDALRAQLTNPESWFSVAPTGDAVTVESAVGKHWSRSAKLAYLPAEGEARGLTPALQFAEVAGVTNLSLCPEGRTLWVIDGEAFNVHRVDTRGGEHTNFGTRAFLRNGGFLVDVIALGDNDFVALWVDALVWLRAREGALEVVDAMPLKLARGFAYDAERRRLIVTSQERARLLVVRAEGDVLALEAKFEDGVKEAMFRGEEIYATMTDGVKFVLRGLA